MLARKERSLRQIATGTGSVNSSGFQWEITTPAEIPKWSPPPIEAGISVLRLYFQSEFTVSPAVAGNMRVIFVPTFSVLSSSTEAP